MAVNAASLLVEVSADVTSAVAGLEAMDAKMLSMSNVSRVATAAVAGGLAVVGGAAVTSALQFDDAVDGIRTGLGVTGVALEGMQESFKAVLKQVPQDMQTVSDSMTSLAQRTGMTGDALESMTVQMLDLARLTNSDIGGLIESTTRLFGDWGIAADQQSGTLDKLYRASQTTGIGVESLAQQMTVAGAQFRLLGFDFDTTAALLGKFEKEGVNADQVVSTLRKGLATLAAEGFQDLPSAFAEISRRIKEATSDTDALSLANEYFGSRAGVQMAAAIREGRFEIADYVDAIANGTDTIQQGADDTAGLTEQMGQLKNQAMLALEPLGTGLVGALETLAPLIGGILEVIAPFADKLFLAAAATFTLVKGVKAVTAIVNAFKAASLTFTMSNPMLLVLGALAAAAVLIVMNWDKVWPVIKKVGEWFADVFKKIWEVVGPVVQKIFDVGKKIFQSLWDGIKFVFNIFWTWYVKIPLWLIEQLWNGLKKLWEVGGAVIQAIWDGMKAVWEFVWHWFVEIPFQIWQTLWNGLARLVQLGGQILHWIWDGILGAWQWLWDRVVGIGQMIWDGIWGVLSGIWNLGVALLHGLWNGIVSVKDWIIDRIKGLARGIIEGFKSIFGIDSPSKVFAEYGVNMMEGLSAGIAGGAQLPADALARVSKGLSADASLRMTAGGSVLPVGGLGGVGGGARPGVTAPIVINVHGSVIRERELGGIVDQALSRRKQTVPALSFERTGWR